MLRVLGLGDNVVDKYMHIRTMYPGGNALNFAVYAKMFGIEAGYLGVFGDDEAAAHVYDTIRGLGLELSHCRFYPGENGYAEVRLDNGDRGVHRLKQRRSVKGTSSGTDCNGQGLYSRL